MLKLYGNIAGYDVVCVPNHVDNAPTLTYMLQEHEYRVIQHGIDAELELASASRSSSFFEIFNKQNWRRTLAGCLGICSQWAAGAPIVFSYSTVSIPTSMFKIGTDTYPVLLQSRRTRRSIPGHNRHVRLAFQHLLVLL